MSWAESIRASVTFVLRDRAAKDEGIIRGTQTASWDPYEVWLTRVKQPRDRAAQAVTAGSGEPGV